MTPKWIRASLFISASQVKELLTEEKIPFVEKQVDGKRFFFLVEFPPGSGNHIELSQYLRPDDHGKHVVHFFQNTEIPQHQIRLMEKMRNGVNGEDENDEFLDFLLPRNDNLYVHVYESTTAFEVIESFELNMSLRRQLDKDDVLKVLRDFDFAKNYILKKVNDKVADLEQRFS